MLVASSPLKMVDGDGKLSRVGGRQEHLVILDLSDHFIGLQQYFRRDRHADFLGRFEVDDQL